MSDEITRGLSESLEHSRLRIIVQANRSRSDLGCQATLSSPYRGENLAIDPAKMAVLTSIEFPTFILVEDSLNVLTVVYSRL